MSTLIERLESRQLLAASFTNSITSPHLLLSASANVTSKPVPLARFGPGYLLSVSRGKGSELWAMNGTDARLLHLNLPLLATDPHAVIPFRDGALLRAGGDLWYTTGHPKTTVYLGSYASGVAVNDPAPRDFTIAGDSAYFVANSFSGPEIFRTDGTPVGTVQVSRLHDRYGVPADVTPYGLTYHDGRLLFVLDIPVPADAPPEQPGRAMIVGIDTTSFRPRTYAIFDVPSDRRGLGQRQVTFVSDGGRLAVLIQRDNHTFVVPIDGTPDGGTLQVVNDSYTDYRFLAFNSGAVLLGSELDAWQFRNGSVQRLAAPKADLDYRTLDRIIPTDTGYYFVMKRRWDPSISAIWYRVSKSDPSRIIQVEDASVPDSVRQQASVAPGAEVTYPSFDRVRIVPQDAPPLPWQDLPDYTTGSIRGTVFSDQNRDGIRQSSERPLSDYRVWLDLDRDGVYSPGRDAVFTTDADGHYFGTGLTSGWSSIRITPPTVGSTLTQRASTFIQIGQIATVDLGVRVWEGNASVTGLAWVDTNRDGKRDADRETPLVGRRVYIDFDEDGHWDSDELSTTTDSTGRYRFDNLPEETVTIRVEPAERAAARATTPTTAVLADDVVRTLPLGLFEDQSNGRVQGRVFADLNNDAVQDPYTEAGLGKVQVTLTHVRSGRQRTLSTNKDGFYDFDSLAEGRYRLDWTGVVNGSELRGVGRVVDLVAGTKQSLGLPLTLPYIRGRLFGDTDGNGIASSDEIGPRKVQVYLDLNNNAQRDNGERYTFTQNDGSYAFLGLWPGTYTIRVNDWTARYLNGGSVQRTLAAGKPVVVNFPMHTGRIQGVFFEDINGNGRQDNPLIENGLSGYIGLIPTTFPTYVSSSGAFDFGFLPPGRYTIDAAANKYSPRYVGSPSTERALRLAAGQTVVIGVPIVL